MLLYSSYIVPYMIPSGNHNFPRSTNKIQFLTKFPHLQKNCRFNESPKYEHQSIFPCGGGSNLILGIGMENQIFILRNPAAVKFFNRIVKK